MPSFDFFTVEDRPVGVSSLELKETMVAVLMSSSPREVEVDSGLVSIGAVSAITL
jgi:hypothetical protein